MNIYDSENVIKCVLISDHEISYKLYLIKEILKERNWFIRPKNYDEVKND